MSWLSCASPGGQAAQSRELRTAADLTQTSSTKLEPSELAEREERRVGVKGIEGTMSSFDVRITMEKQNKEFAKCHEPRARSVPALSGSIEFGIHVLRDGRVGAVHVRDSDLGDRVLERCLSEVIEAAKFQAPNGGEADIKWNMQLAPTGRARVPEQWARGRVERVVRKHRRALLATCDARGVGVVTVTAYVARSGRILAAGVAAEDAGRVSAQQFDCIADELMSWTMPKPRTGVAKVSFPIHADA